MYVCMYVCMWRENKNKLFEWKRLVDTVGIKSADLEDKFLS